MDPDQQKEDPGDDREPDPEVALHGLHDRRAEVVGGKPDHGRPGHGAGDVPHHEAAEAHPADPGHPAQRRTQDGNESAEEDRLRAVSLEELLRAFDAVMADALEPWPADEELASPEPSDDVAEKRSGHGGHDGDGDDRDDVPVSLRRESARGDQRGLARNERKARHLEKDDDEHDPEPVVRDEVRHGA